MSMLIMPSWPISSNNVNVKSYPPDLVLVITSMLILPSWPISSNNANVKSYPPDLVLVITSMLIIMLLLELGQEGRI
jgi:ABC-type uncharacterized transport system permease subunit